MNPWPAYAALARQLHHASRSVYEHEVDHGARMDQAAARLHELRDVVDTQQKAILELAARLKFPVPTLLVPAEVEATTVDDALGRAVNSFLAAGEAAEEAQSMAQRSPRLPRWPALARHALVYLLATAAGFILNISWVEFIRDQEASGGDHSGLLLLILLTPLFAWLGSIVAIHALFTPPLRERAVETSIGWGAAICFPPLLLCCCFAGSFNIPYI